MPDKYSSPKHIINSAEFKPVRALWKSPSNIALVKYWGKYGRQIPSNPSVSFTLSEAHTVMELRGKLREDTHSDSIQLELYFEKERNPAFEKRISLFLEGVKDIFPFIAQLKLTVHTHNSFPHSSGIASSASSMSALALCLCDLEEQLFVEDSGSEFYKKASYVARLASGSACRSVFGPAALWGFTKGVDDSSDEHAIPVDNMIHPVFKSFKDAILVVSDQPKSVSSSEGHALMDMHQFSRQRFEVAGKNLQNILRSLKLGHVDEVGEIIENEALMLHALMLTSNPSYILFDPNTIAVINRVRSFRQDTGIPLFFTLDAGPNVHLLYPEDVSLKVESFIEDQLLPYCIEGKSIFDQCGKGPEKIKSK
nr:diphosphomevalonate decarboxylase [Saprospiraceae bacterium]